MLNKTNPKRTLNLKFVEIEELITINLMMWQNSYLEKVNESLNTDALLKDIFKEKGNLFQ